MRNAGLSGWVGGAAAVAVLLVSLGASFGHAEAEEALYGLIEARLELMDEVAAYKWHRAQPIADAGREAVVLDHAVAEALRFGFRPTASREFFAAQIDAAKEIQRHWFATWRAGVEPPAAPDLEEQVRPELLRLGQEILEAASSASGPPSRQAFEAAVAVEGLSTPTRAAIFAALTKLEPYASRLEQVLDSGVLRVGTTGDYAPFSHRSGGARVPEGIDIDLARRLADALAVKVAFVATSWPDLLGDLAAGRYDIAMSGVSRTVERQRVGYLSPPYYVGGKTPIARCADAQAFGSLAAIDRPEVRVVVNPGGTNEAFVDAHLHRARKVPHEDNRTIFEALIDQRADVMITDRIEVELQTARHAGTLCATMPGTLTYQEKAYLMPQDGPWKEFVSTWLELAIADGTVAAVFREHGVEPGLGAREGRTGGR